VPELPNTKKAGIHATHTDMCKFANENSPGWNILAGILIEYAENAPERVSWKWEQLRGHERIDMGWRMEGFIGRRMFIFLTMYFDANRSL
jgi:hypothetical protein